ncbi:hypothetical protein PsorP6_015640 [Peronosclerospora sorghi]|uniref:Uncharacterized protein n=1 Tax=Peronosclerospora sorghi TaxID=230839 RepID=A0ACC0WQ42_9STRA|nr:hypothetical protein PsorP6_015640 [Peronosclerospora sorghi]
MRRQPLLLLVTFAFVAVANVAPSSALGYGESGDPSAGPSRNKEEERIGAVSVFKMLRLHKVTDQLFERRRFRLWVQYMKLFNQYSEAAIMLTLNSVYEDKKVAAIIIEAKKVSKTEAIATELQKLQLEMWTYHEKSPADVFEWLQLKNKEAKDLAPLFRNPEFRTWKKYLKLTSEQPKDVNRRMVLALTTHYKNKRLAQLILSTKYKADEDRKVKRLAKTLQVAQLQLWLLKGVDPDTASRWMVLKGKKWLKNAEEELLSQYQEYYKKLYPPMDSAVSGNARN